MESPAQVSVYSGTAGGACLLVGAVLQHQQAL